jgi:uncharacterized protein with NRDE domain
MCLIAFAVRAHPRYPLVVAANRDEWFERPTAQAHFWADHPYLLAGRDLQGGGTWLGITRTGRFAALTNVREPGKHRPDAPSRGKLVERFLASDIPAADYASALERRADEYNGYNFLCGTIAEGLRYYSNRGEPAAAVPNGIYGVSNHLLDTDWPKVRRSRARLGTALTTETVDPFALFDLLADTDPAPDHELPATGVTLEWERMLSSTHIRATSRPIATGHGRYGTRSATVLLVESAGFGQLTERTFSPEGGIVNVVTERFALAPGAVGG